MWNRPKSRSIMPWIIYSMPDAKNCALLKETVIDFFAENDTEAITKVCFNDVPGYVMKDLLVATARKKKVTKATAKDDYGVML